MNKKKPEAFKENRKNITMQVIKFRGRSIADGSIVYGGVLQYATASFIVQPDTRHADGSPRCIEVHPDSVAQYINVKTVDGEEIYTGDEVRILTGHSKTPGGIVQYNNETASFCIDGAYICLLFFAPDFEYELIHQTPKQ